MEGRLIRANCFRRMTDKAKISKPPVRASPVSIFLTADHDPHDSGQDNAFLKQLEVPRHCQHGEWRMRPKRCCEDARPVGHARSRYIRNVEHVLTLEHDGPGEAGLTKVQSDGTCRR
jgi:hypothetical protein